MRHLPGRIVKCGLTACTCHSMHRCSLDALSFTLPIHPEPFRSARWRNQRRYTIDNGTLHRTASFGEMMMLRDAAAVADVCNIWRRCGCIGPILGCSRMMNHTRCGVHIYMLYSSSHQQRWRRTRAGHLAKMRKRAAAAVRLHCPL